MVSKSTVIRPWEKAVEHGFLLKAARRRSMSVAMPLDGDAEVAGDTIFGAGAACILVEFKRDSDASRDELVKFAARKQSGKKEDKEKDKALAAAAYDYAASHLGTCDQYHFLVYGEWGFEAGTPSFQLHAQTYFSNEKVDGPAESIVDEGAGWSERQLAEYISEFVRIKLHGAPDEAGDDGSEEDGAGAGVAAHDGANELALEDVDATFIIAVSAEGGFMIPLAVVAPSLLKLLARLKNAPKKNTI